MEPLSEEQINQLLTDLDGWGYEDDTIVKEYTFNNFKEALGFIVRIGMEAEAHAHHPQIFNVYNNVTIGLQTHDAGDKVTQKDIDLAKAIDGIL